MPWFKVDDNFASHPKAVAAGNAALGLWVRAGAWSMQQLTDGYIPGNIARILGKHSEAVALVNAGLWIPKDDGYLFHEWAERQPTRIQLEAQQEQTRQRQRRGREAQARRRAAERAATEKEGSP